MADLKISQLTGATTPLAGTEVLPIVQSGSTVKVAVSNLTAGRDVATGALSATGLISTTKVGLAFTAVSSTTGIAYANLANTSGNFIFGCDNSTGNALFSGSTGYASFAGSLTNKPFYLLSDNTPVVKVTSTDVTFTASNLVQGTAAKGINFTANTPAAGMTSQLLNWYEEGTWTPVDGSGAGLAFTVTDAVYTREGNMVFASASVTYPITASAAGAAIGGLPFTIGAVGAYGAFLRYTNYGDFMTWLANPSGTVLFAYSKVGASITNVGASAKRFDIVAIYKV